MIKQEQMYNLERMYNPLIKEQFLLTLNEDTDTRKTYANVFYKTKSIEEKLDYDLANFNRDEIGNVLKRFNSLTYNGLRARARIVENYITWAMRNGIRDNNIHPLKDADDEYYRRYYIEKKLYFSKDQLDEMKEEMRNFQDKALFYLIFEIGFGQSGSRILGLKKNDVNFEKNTVTINDEIVGEKEVDVSDECLVLISAAINENRYKAKNGLGIGRNADRPLIENDYVLRNAKTRSDHNERADKHLIYRRISTMSDYFSLPYLTSKVIERSGMLYYCYKQLKEGKYTEINNELLKEIGDKFGMKKSMINGELNYNFYLMREYINPEVITSLYDDIEL